MNASRRLTFQWIRHDDINSAQAGGLVAVLTPTSAGIGLRAAHQQVIARERPSVRWLEVHSENYFDDGGIQIERLMEIRTSYPVSLHGVGASLGSVDSLDDEHMRKLKRLVCWSDPVFVSEHLAWGSVEGVHLNDLLPLPYTQEALEHMAKKVDQIQNILGRQILIENISSYLQFAHSQMAEWEFMTALASECGCGLLLDINNVYVNACNHIFDARRYISALAHSPVREIHLAGHSRNTFQGRELLIDSHAGPVSEPVWKLYDFALSCLGPVPTLIEWDADIPPLETLLVEANKATGRLELARAFAA